MKEATNAVRRARHLMGRVVAALSRLLPKRTGARLARELLGAYAVKVTKDALSLSDVSVDESECLKKLLTEAFDPCGLLVVSAGGGRSDADAEAAALIEGLEGHGMFIFIFVWAIGLTSCFVYRVDERERAAVHAGRANDGFIGVVGKRPVTRARVRRGRGRWVREGQLRGE